ncbi:MAG: hypothetical protein AAF567_07030 [Actinomycetota bacterium]
MNLDKARSLEWIGQTIASICWLISVLVYGLEAVGDWLQLGAASAWLAANLAAVFRRDKVVSAATAP